MGPRVRRVRRGREAVLADRARHQLPAHRRLGRARRPARGRARQLRAPLPRRLGHRHRRGRAVRPVGQAGGRGRAAHASTTGTGSTSWSSSGGAVTGVRGTVLAPDDAAARRRRPAATRSGDFELTAQAVDRHHRRHRRQPRPRPPLLAGAARHAARRDGHRRPRLRGRPDARHRAPAPASAWSTATGCGTTPRACRTGTRSGPATASGSCPARRRCGSTRSAAGCPRPCLPGYDTLGTLRHLRTTADIAGHDHSWFVLTQRIIEKEFALSGLRAEPRHHRQGPAGLPARAAARQGRRRRRWRRSSATAPTSSSAGTLEELVAKMNALTDKPLLDAGRDPRARSRPATCRSPTRTARTPRSRASATPAATSATGSAASPPRTASSTRPPAR